jgi:hypothetical protein
MKRIRIAGLCLVAVFAMSAVAVSSASALPTYQVCKKAAVKEHGTFNNKNCTGASKGGKKEGDYELGAWNQGKEASPKTKNTNGTSTLTSYIKGFGIVGAVTCTKAKGEGRITGPSTGNVTVTFEKCTSSGESCASAGESAGKIKTALLTTTLAENEEKTAVIIRVGEAGAPSASFSCGAEKVVTTGTADGVDTGNVNTFSKDATNTFSVNAGGEQVNTVDGDVLLTEVVGTGTFESGENTTASVKGEEMEIAAEL